MPTNNQPTVCQQVTIVLIHSSQYKYDSRSIMVVIIFCRNAFFKQDIIMNDTSHEVYTDQHFNGPKAYEILVLDHSLKLNKKVEWLLTVTGTCDFCTYTKGRNTIFPCNLWCEGDKNWQNIDQTIVYSFENELVVSLCHLYSLFTGSTLNIHSARWHTSSYIKTNKKAQLSTCT